MFIERDFFYTTTDHIEFIGLERLIEIVVHALVNKHMHACSDECTDSCVVLDFVFLRLLFPKRYSSTRFRV